MMAEQNMSDSDVAKVDGDGAGRQEKNPVSIEVSEEKMKVHRGDRHLRDIQLETMQRINGKIKL